jgi:hypothetical protein
MSLILPERLGINDNQKAAKTIYSCGDASLFAVRILLFNGDSKWVFEGCRGIGEAHAMVSSVDLRLLRVPFEINVPAGYP